MERGMNWVGLPLMMSGIFIAAQLISIVFYWLILKKAGYGQWVWALAMVVPGVSLIALAFVALAEWPIQREVRELRSRTGVSPPRPNP